MLIKFVLTLFDCHSHDTACAGVKNQCCLPICISNVSVQTLSSNEGPNATNTCMVGLRMFMYG